MVPAIEYNTAYIPTLTKLAQSSALEQSTTPVNPIQAAADFTLQKFNFLLIENQVLKNEILALRAEADADREELKQFKNAIYQLFSAFATNGVK